jgi:hypothetical protein
VDHAVSGNVDLVAVGQHFHERIEGVERRLHRDAAVGDRAGRFDLDFGRARVMFPVHVRFP